MAVQLVVAGSRHPSTRHFGPLFDSGHLRPELAEVVEPFAVCARSAVDLLPDGIELSACLRKLVEAKDCAVRARIIGLQSGQLVDPASPVSPAQALGYDERPV